VWTSIDQSTMRLPHRRLFVCTTLGERKAFPRARPRAASVIPPENWFQKRAGVSSVARGPLRWRAMSVDSETDNDVHVNLGIRPTVPRATAKVAERLLAHRYTLLSDNAAFRHRHRTIR